MGRYFLTSQRLSTRCPTSHCYPSYMWLAWTLASFLRFITTSPTDTQFVVYNGASSDTSPVVSGVPQGSILGPLLFLIYIDNMCEVSLSPGSKLVLYAHNILLYRPICKQLVYTKQHDLQCFQMQGHAHLQEKEPVSSILTTLTQWHHPWSSAYLWEYDILWFVMVWSYSWGLHQGKKNSRPIVQTILPVLHQQQIASTLIVPGLATSGPAQAWDPHLQCDINALEN